MKRILLIALCFISIISFGQYQTTNLDFLFNGSIDASDSTLIDSITGVSDSGYKLTDVDFDITLGYLPGKTGAKLNGQPIITLFQNTNFADTTFNQWLEHEINADSTELYPFRVQRIAHYSSATTDDNNYFGSIPPTGLFVSPTLGNDVTGDGSIGNPYATYAKGASIGNNRINLMDGQYDVGGSSLTVTDSLYCIGNCEFVNLPSGYLFLSNMDFTMIRGIWADFNNTTDYLTYIGNVNETIEHCYIKNAQFQFIFTAVTAKTLTVRKNYYNSSNGASNECLRIGFQNFNFSDNCIDFVGNRLFQMINTSLPNSNIYNNDLILNTVATYYTTIDQGEINFYSNYITNGGVVFSLANYDFSINAIGNTGNTSGYFIRAIGGLGDIKVRHNDITVSGVQPFVTYSTGRNLDFQYNTITHNGAAPTLNGSSTSSVSVDFNYNTIINNSIGGNIGIGADGITSILNLNVIGNNLIWANAYPTHGIQVLNNTGSTNMSYNYSEGCPLPYIFKGEGTDYTNSIMSYNVAINGQITLKGVDNATIVNNTVKVLERNITCIDVLKNVTYGCDGNIIKNNIFFNSTTSADSTLALCFLQEDELNVTYISDYNILYNTTDSRTAKINTVNYDFATWQGLGNDANSYNTNPNFKSSTELYVLSPSDAIGNGATIGAPYNFGLDKTSVWTDNIVLKEQPTNWYIGAYADNDLPIPTPTSISNLYIIGGRKKLIIIQ